ncbi:tetratricopeptide repeat-containing sensor histidine kinase [Edaphocola aurantiacus]|uniref:tetratricopeptide repeat-containing sensor histidine kinase n=1 Tax=Edaphocola aurantiacus TaxID=2601682 RepID=UPI001C9849C3|nr:ATP-binding protein [Edaphocola aurantiacus]
MKKKYHYIGLKRINTFLKWTLAVAIIALITYIIVSKATNRNIKWLNHKQAGIKQIDSLNQQAQILSDKQDFTTAETLIDSAIYLSDSLSYKKGLADGLFGTGKIQYIKGNYETALECALNSLHINTGIADEVTIGRVRNLLGLIHLAQGETSEAREELNLALNINLRLNDSTKLAANYFNIGLCFSEQALYREAEQAYRTAAFIAQRTGKKNIELMVRNRLGEMYLKMGKTQTAISYYFMVIKDTAYQNDWENSFAYTGLAECYEQLGNNTTAVDYAEKGWLLAQKNGTKWDANRALAVLRKIYAGQGNFEKAYQYTLLNIQYQDSLFNEKKQSSINALNLKHQRLQNYTLQQKNLISAQENKFQRVVIICFLAVTTLLIILITIIYRSSGQKDFLNKELTEKSRLLALRKEEIKRQKDQLSELNETKDMILSVISHDLRSPLSSIILTLNVIRNMDVSREDFQSILEKMNHHTLATRNMIDQLLNWANSQSRGLIAYKTEINAYEVTEEILSVFEHEIVEKQLAVKHTATVFAAIFADIDQFQVIIRNIIDNAIKFTPDKGTISIDYQSDVDSTIIIIQDTGVGMSAEKLSKLFHSSGKQINSFGTKNETGFGIGLTLVKSFVDANGGKIEVSSSPGNGTEFHIYFPRP